MNWLSQENLPLTDQSTVWTSGGRAVHGIIERPFFNRVFVLQGEHCMNISAWAPSLNNPYALIGFIFLILSALATTFVVRERLPRTYLVGILGLAAMAVLVLLVILIKEGDGNRKKEEPSSGASIRPKNSSPASINFQTVEGSGNVTVNNSNGSVNINSGINGKP